MWRGERFNRWIGLLVIINVIIYGFYNSVVEREMNIIEI